MAKRNGTLRPADVVRQSFGRVMTMRALAGELGCQPSTLTRWWTDTPHTGATGGGITNGMIPAKWHARLLQLATIHGVRLTARDLILGRRK